MDKLRFLRCFEMRTKIEANGNGIMSGDVIYINKRNSNITSVDKKKYSELLERFVKGTRPITEENFLNITVGYSMIVGFLIEQIRKSPELWDIFQGNIPINWSGIYHVCEKVFIIEFFPLP